MVDVGASDTTMGANAITLGGGTKSNADYVSLGGSLLPKDGSAITLEFWATQHSLQTWSRIFDVGVNTSENLFMSWSQTAATDDRVEWKDGVTATVNNSVAPYTFDTEYHIILMIEPGAGVNGATKVTWFAAPSSAADLGPAKGSFETSLTPADLNDANFWLGRSQYEDRTANASYNEVRIWNRAFGSTDLESLHDLGPDSVGDFPLETVDGSLAGTPTLSLGAGAEFDIGGQTQQVASLAGAAGSVIRLGGGQLQIAAPGEHAVVFAGTFVGTGTVVNHGTLRLVGNAAWPAGISLVNYGLLDIMTWQGELPAGFINNGSVLDRSKVKVDAIESSGNDFKVTIHGYRGHGYRLQWTDDLVSKPWQDIGDPLPGEDAPLQFSHGPAADEPRGFYRVLVSP